MTDFTKIQRICKILNYFKRFQDFKSFQELQAISNDFLGFSKISWDKRISHNFQRF